MIARKAGKILLYCFAGLLGVVLLVMLGVKIALDQAPAYQAEIKQWVHAQTGYNIEFAGVSPTAERLAAWIWRRVDARIRLERWACRLARLRLTLEPGFAVEIEE